MSSSAQTIAFIPPRYGKEIVGGAEAVIAEAAHGLAMRGYNVEVLTTCAKDHYTWANEYPAGVEQDGKVTVRRFPVELDTPGIEREAIGGKILGGQVVPIEEQQRWANDSLRCSSLWHYVSQNGHNYRSFIFAPYMFWTTYAVSQIFPRKSIVMPCMHDEPEAYLDIFQPVINGAGGIWFLTEPEAELAGRIFDIPSRNSIVGAAVDIPESYNPESFIKKFSIKTPYLYYAGRREWGKGWQDLVEAFGQIISENPRCNLSLVTSGVGDIECAPHIRQRIIDVGFLSEEDRNNAMAGALAYVQPSARESFSRTVLEAWLAGTPVIANGMSEVVKWHVQRSQAGFCYNNIAEMVESILLLTQQSGAAAKLAEPGRKYVLDNYQWSQVLDRMEASLEQWMPLLKLMPVSQTAGVANV